MCEGRANVDRIGTRSDKLPHDGDDRKTNQLLVSFDSKYRRFDGVGKSTCLENLSTLLKQQQIESSQFKTPTEQLMPFRAYFDKQPTAIRRAYYLMCNVHLSYLITQKYGTANDDNNDGTDELRSVNRPRRSVLLVDRWWSSTFAYGMAEKIKSGELQPI